jgi:DNA topoisomerase-1
MADKYNLVTVESPGKVEKITKYLNSNPELKKYGQFKVIASVGHIRDLPPKSLGIDIEKNFAMTYEFSEGKKQVIENLKKYAKNAKTVYLASDNDDEGCQIGESVRIALNLGQNYKRIIFTEISSKALQYAIEHPGKIDQDQLEAQETRRSLDRIVGYKLSPVLWKKFTNGGMSKLSAGRVQSAVLHLIIEKEKEIEKFKSSAYWYIFGNFNLKINTETQKIEEVKLYKDTTVYKEETKDNLINLFKKIKNEFTIKEVKNRESKQKPDLPFITSSLQQSSGLGVKRTMQLAQDLYELGLITYHRTDSYVISDDFKVEAKNFIETKYGSKYLGELSDMKSMKAVKGAQSAHECIRPVNIDKYSIKDEDKKITKDHEKLYEMIYNRTIAYFMKACIYDELELKIIDSSFAPAMYFLATFKKVKFNGFQIVYGIKNEIYDFNSYIDNIKNKKYDIKSDNITAKNTWTNPPQRYNEVGLVKLMESNGIGRPSTYSATLQKVTEKQYVNKTDTKGEEKQTINYILDPKTKVIKEQKSTVNIGQEKSKYVPTEIGLEIDKFLEENFDYIIDKEFTANMEAELDRISEGKKSRLEVLNSFWKPFSKDLSNFTKIAKEDKIDIKTESNDFKVNGVVYTVRLTRFGPVVQYENKDNKKTYIDLKNYLKYVGKEYTDIDVNDIKFLTKFPMKLGIIKGKEVMALMGPYGIYMKYDGNNLKITQKMIRELIDTGKIDQKDIEASIEYNKNKTPRAKTAEPVKTEPVKTEPVKTEPVKKIKIKLKSK